MATYACYVYPPLQQISLPKHKTRWLEWIHSDRQVLSALCPPGVTYTIEDWLQAQAGGYQYCVTYLDGIAAASGAVWKYSEDAWEVAAIGTPEVNRRKGLARSVVCFVTKYVLEQNRKATLTTHINNVGMRALAESVGYELTALE